ncbi:hypothetical protein EXU30_00030 [Shewanella maritima]|uniref:Uncharacterized protein n=1 Tax=Shewanella maritima TaxID=2520507 RepID=A0A411PCF3_9GAMM|nr:hypothetical protein [Shewanella maritima]QBF81257.1 hypothetical protein EXU30_00030 [Shewanella maritima]
MIAKTPTKTRAQRPFAALHRDRWSGYLKTPSGQVSLLTPCGRATQRRFLKDIATVMDCLVSNMCLRTRKIGVVARNGFFLYTWEKIALTCNLPLWRVKQCAARAMENGWIESTQPRGLTMHKGKPAYVCLASIKRITIKYIKLTGLKEAFAAAHAAAKKSIVNKSKLYNKPIKTLLTPITLLAKFKRDKDVLAPPN